MKSRRQRETDSGKGNWTAWQTPQNEATIQRMRMSEHLFNDRFSILKNDYFFANKFYLDIDSPLEVSHCPQLLQWLYS